MSPRKMIYYFTFQVFLLCISVASPQSKAKDMITESTTYLLYTRTNPVASTEIVPNNDTTLGNYNPDNDNKILMHGYTGNENTTWMHDMKDAFLQEEDVNVILVDWGPLAGGLYPEAASYTKPVGEYIGTLITYLITLGTTFQKIHIIGKSLGAQTAGFAGAAVGGQVARLTGLDPGGPLYEDVSDDERLDPSDAVFVEVIHTNAGTLTEGAFGQTWNSGHVDFWPNGGTRQAGCYDPFETIPDIATGCSHDRSTEFYIESIQNKNAFVSYPCSNYTSYSAGECTSCGPDGCHNMGYGSEQGQTGVYYLATRIVEPFSGKQVFVDLNISQNQQPATGHIFLTLNSPLGSDKAEVLIEGGKNKIDPEAKFHSVIAVLNNLQNFNGGIIEFDQEGTEPPTTLQIDFIQVWDPQTEQKICANTSINVPDGGNVTVLFNTC